MSAAGDDVPATGDDVPAADGDVSERCARAPARRAVVGEGDVGPTGGTAGAAADGDPPVVAGDVPCGLADAAEDAEVASDADDADTPDDADDAEDPDDSEDADDAVPPIQVRLVLAEPNAAARFARASSGGLGVDSARRTGS